MSEIISIKEARLKKGLSLEELAFALKLDKEIIRLLEEDLQLPEKFKAYRSTYKKTIYRYLGYKINYETKINQIPTDYSKIFIVNFLIILVLIIVIFFSYNIYQRFNQIEIIKIFEPDKIQKSVHDIISEVNLEFISNENFKTLLIAFEQENYSQTFELYPKKGKSLFYKIQNLDKQNIEFGELNGTKFLSLNLDNNYLLDLSDINNIDKIVYKGVKFKIKNDDQFALKNFEILEMELLL